MTWGKCSDWGGPSLWAALRCETERGATIPITVIWPTILQHMSWSWKNRERSRITTYSHGESPDRRSDCTREVTWGWLSSEEDSGVACRLHDSPRDTFATRL